VTSPAVAPGALTTPSLRRRLAAFVYEGVLLFGVVMVPGLVYAVLTKQTHALSGTRGLQWSVFLVVGAYFVYCWSRSGQTLAMQTWRIRLVDQAGGRVSAPRAALRYLLAWVWFAPALLTLQFTGLGGSGASAFVALLAGVRATPPWPGCIPIGSTGTTPCAAHAWSTGYRHSAITEPYFHESHPSQRLCLLRFTPWHATRIHGSGP